MFLLLKRRLREVYLVGIEGRKLERFFFRFEYVIDMRIEWICDLSSIDMDYNYMYIELISYCICWKFSIIIFCFRSYSRVFKMVFLEVSFVLYDEDILLLDIDKILVSRLFFYIFWIFCVRYLYVELDVVFM